MTSRSKSSFHRQVANREGVRRQGVRRQGVRRQGVRRQGVRRRRAGLILLIVLGMLALFTLLAVTYSVSATASRAGTRGMEVKARNGSLTIAGTAKAVVTDVIRGTNNQKSPFYRQSLLEDIFGPNPIITQFGPYNISSGNSARRFYVAQTGVNLVKLSISPQTQLNGPLSDFENEYNSRIMTIMEGPLSGQSFRILKYVGYVRDNTPGAPADPNIVATPWSAPGYIDPLAADTRYSILVDLNEVIGREFTGEYFDVTTSSLKTASFSVEEWITRFGVQSLFYLQTGPANFIGYKLLINDAAYNSPGIGLEDVAAVPDPVNGTNPPIPIRGFGNIDAKRLLRTLREISPAMLTHYDYLQDPALMATNPYDSSVGVDGIGTARTDVRQFKLNGSSNEAFDVSDYRDAFLANQSFAGGVLTIKPSYHNPEVVNYISHLFGNPSGLSPGDVNELIRLIDASTARVLSYLTNNSGFRENDPSVVRLPSSFSWSTPPTAPEIAILRGFVLNQIMGPWDVDNDGDGIPDSVWINPQMPIVYAPDGRRLRALAAVLTEDLDGRVNLNTSGDRVQMGPAFNVTASSPLADFRRPSVALPQGFGYGPADISLSSLFKAFTLPNPLVQSTALQFSFFDELAGGRRYTRRPINFNDPILDRMSGQKRALVDLSITTLQERENHFAFEHHKLPGLPMARRGSYAMSFDRNGNPVLVNVSVTDANPYNPGVADVPHETYNDRYESAAMELPTADDPLGLRELESILRRYDEDSAALSNRLRSRITQIQGGTQFNLADPLNREITIRSGELRYPDLSAAMKNSAVTAQSSAPGYLRYIQMLHNQRHRIHSFPATAADDPLISYAALSELFPVDFASGLRMDLNRPFGDGIDNNGDGEVDEPSELVGTTQTETFSVGNTAFTSTGSYVREIKDIRKTAATIGDGTANNNNSPILSPTRARLGSRQILARNLYCLAQLIIPRDYVFPGMAGTPGAFEKARIRATAIAQWAVNVVDYRDADVVNTRFEFDILPFGSGTLNGMPAKEAFWAPDRMAYPGMKPFIGVVWGMEMPELLLTENIAMHATRLRDTDLEVNGKTTTDPTTPDNDLDQYRFPEASLYIEMTNPRTTSVANNAILPGLPSSLYDTAGLKLDQLAPAGGPWGAQPVWRIGFSDMYPNSSSEHPNARLRAITPNAPDDSFRSITHQWSTEAANGFTADGTALTGTSSISRGDGTNTSEQYVGSGLLYDTSDKSLKAPNAATAMVPNYFDRFVWFTNLRPGDTVPVTGGTVGAHVPDINPAVRSLGGGELASIYGPAAGGARLPGGSYLVIGPRSTTNVGSLTHNQFDGTLYPTELKRTSISATNRPILSPSYQRIALTSAPDPNSGDTATTYLMNNVPANAPWLNRTKDAVTMICSTKEPTGWSTAFPSGIGLNISFPTPVAGQTIWQPNNIPTKKLNTADTQGSGRPDGTPGFNEMPPDSWIDVSALNATDALPDEPIDYSNPLLSGSAARLRTGTYENVRTAYLQRLADPEFPYDPVMNPYITVDWMPIDLTVFNGESPIGSDPNDTPGPVKFQSRYKDGSLSPLATGHNVSADKGISYHSPITGALKITPTQTNLPTITVTGISNPVYPDSYFTYQLGYDKLAYGANNIGNSASTFGYCNVGYYVPGGLPTPAQMATLDYTQFDGFGPPIDSANLSYKGTPARLESVLWLNRPFASPYELMMVPLTSPGQFGLYHSAYSTVQKREQFGAVPSFQTTNAWSVSQPPSAAAPGFWAIPQSPVLPGSSRVADWPLLLEFVETQPPFVDANKFYRPDTMLGQSTTDPIARRFLNSFLPQGYTIPDVGPASAVAVSESFTVRGPSLLAPFNRRPSYVAAGKINLNTLAFDSAGQSRALKALEHNYLANERNVETSQIAAAFQLSRQGYSTVPANTFFGAVTHPAMHPDYPTRFVGAYRPAMSSNIAPQLASPAATERMRGRYGVESTLLRAAAEGTNNLLPPALQSSPTNRDMLFVATRGGVSTPATPTLADEHESLQPFLRMQRAMRLPNIATNQSNVFAVWVTVSLFEYDPVTGFGNEYVGDTGLPQRERQFFIIDRTIPVGFKPGETLNSDRTILLQRTIP